MFSKDKKYSPLGESHNQPLDKCTGSYHNYLPNARSFTSTAVSGRNIDLIMLALYFTYNLEQQQ